MMRFVALLLALATAGLLSAGGALAQPISNQEAKELFATTCGWCHENGGRQAGKGPKLAGTTRSDSFILNRIEHGSDTGMPAFEGTLSNDQVLGLLQYIRSLKSE